MIKPLFLPGVPERHVLDRLAQAGGDEVGSGKFTSPESSAALAVNALGWFVERSALLPPLPGAEHAGIAQRVEIEHCARFPWTGGRHPWLDAAVFTDTHVIGVESKRYEPFRDTKRASFSDAYDRPVWGERMEGYCAVRDAFKSGALAYRHLDAVQLVKHAYGLFAEGRRLGLVPHLAYVFAEPHERGSAPISEQDRNRHRAETADFAARVAGDEVGFGFASYREWLSGATEEVRRHADALFAAFAI